MSKDIEEMGLAIEHMKVMQLTSLQAQTNGERICYVRIIKHGIARNKEILAELYELQDQIIHKGRDPWVHDKMAVVIRNQIAWAEKFSSELEANLSLHGPLSLNADGEPLHKEPLAQMCFLRPKA